MKPEFSSMTLTAMEPYITGKLYSDTKAKYEPINIDAYKEFLIKLEQYDVAKMVFERTDVWQDFYKYCTDFVEWFPKQRKDLFYAAKYGGVLEDCPMSLAYTIKKALEECPSPNMVPLFLGSSAMYAATGRNSFGSNTTLYDVICNIYGKAYDVISSTTRQNDCGDFIEVYVPNEDMILLTTKGMAEVMTPEFMSTVHMGSKGLVSDKGVAVMNLLGHNGICDSYYDLRKLE